MTTQNSRPDQPQLTQQPPVGMPYPPPPPVRSRPRKPRQHWRSQPCRNGCLGLLLGSVLLLMLPVFLVGMLLVVYLLFPPPQQNVIILGLDARPGEGYTTRTDAIMLMGVQPAELRAGLLSIPRDLYLTVPGYGLQRANAVNVLGEMEEAGRGATLIQEAITSSFGVIADHYARINFAAFIALVDALGGIDIDVPRQIVDYQYPTADYGTTTLRFEPGVEHMDGERALAYARTRHADDDYRRAERQQQVITAIGQAMMNPANWPRIPAVVTAFVEAVDTDMSVGELLLLAPPVVLSTTTGSLDQIVIDRDYILLSSGGQAVPNYTALAPWVDANLR
ncbi:LCP family protein [Chloroflexota bacterium]